MLLLLTFLLRFSQGQVLTIYTGSTGCNDNDVYNSCTCTGCGGFDYTFYPPNGNCGACTTQFCQNNGCSAVQGCYATSTVSKSYNVQDDLACHSVLAPLGLYNVYYKLDCDPTGDDSSWWPWSSVDPEVEVEAVEQTADWLHQFQSDVVDSAAPETTPPPTTAPPPTAPPTTAPPTTAPPTTAPPTAPPTDTPTDAPTTPVPPIPTTTAPVPVENSNYVAEFNLDSCESTAWVPVVSNNGVCMRLNAISNNPFFYPTSFKVDCSQSLLTAGQIALIVIGALLFVCCCCYFIRKKKSGGAAAAASGGTGGGYGGYQQIQ